MAYEMNGSGGGTGGTGVAASGGPAARFEGVWLVGTANGAQRSIAGLALTIDRSGITITGPEADQSHVLPWADIQQLAAGEPMAYSDGSPATVVTVTLPGHVAHFLVPPDQLPPDSVAGLCRLSEDMGGRGVPRTLPDGGTNGNGNGAGAHGMASAPDVSAAVPGGLAVDHAEAQAPAAPSQAPAAPSQAPAAPSQAPAGSPLAPAGPSWTTPVEPSPAVGAGVATAVAGSGGDQVPEAAVPASPLTPPPFQTISRVPTDPAARREDLIVKLITAGVGSVVAVVIVAVLALLGPTASPSAQNAATSPSGTTPTTPTASTGTTTTSTTAVTTPALTGPPATATLQSVAPAVSLSPADLPGWQVNTLPGDTVPVAADSTLAGCLGIPVADIGLITQHIQSGGVPFVASGPYIGNASGIPSTMTSNVALLPTPTSVANDLSALQKAGASTCMTTWYGSVIEGETHGVITQPPTGTVFTPQAVTGVTAIGFRMDVGYQPAGGNAAVDYGDIVVIGAGRIEAAIVDGGVNAPLPTSFETAIVQTVEKRVAAAATNG